MSYSLKDVDEAEALVRSMRPETLISRDDYDWSLAVKDKDSTVAVILFQCGDETRPEIRSSLDDVRNVCFWLGRQWTPEQIKILEKARPHQPIIVFNRIITASNSPIPSRT